MAIGSSELEVFMQMIAHHTSQLDLDFIPAGEIFVLCGILGLSILGYGLDYQGHVGIGHDLVTDDLDPYTSWDQRPFMLRDHRERW